MTLFLRAFFSLFYECERLHILSLLLLGLLRSRRRRLQQLTLSLARSRSHNHARRQRPILLNELVVDSLDEFATAELVVEVTAVRAGHSAAGAVPLPGRLSSEVRGLDRVAPAGLAIVHGLVRGHPGRPHLLLADRALR